MKITIKGGELLAQALRYRRPAIEAALRAAVKAEADKILADARRDMVLQSLRYHFSKITSP